MGEGLRQEYSLAVAGIRGPCPTQADDVPDELVSQWTRDAQKDHTRSDIPDRFNKGQCRRVVQNLGSERLHSVECFVHFNVSNHCRAQLYRQLIVGKRILLDQLDVGLHTGWRTMHARKMAASMNTTPRLRARVFRKRYQSAMHSWLALTCTACATEQRRDGRARRGSLGNN